MDDLTSRRLPPHERVTAPWPRDLDLFATDAMAGAVRRFMFGFFVVMCAAAIAWPLLPRRYEAAGSIVLRPTDREGQSDSVQSMRQPLDDNAVQSEMDVVAATKIVDAVIAHHDIAIDPEFAAISSVARLKDWLRPGPTPLRLTEAELRSAVRSHILTARDRRSYTVKVGFWSSDPAKAYAISRTILDTYLDEQIARKRRVAEQLFKWLEQRVDLIRAKQQASTQAMEDFATSSGLVDRGAQISLDAQLVTLSQEAALAKARAIDVSTRASTLAAMRTANALDGAPEVLASTTIQALKQNLSAALGRTVVMSPEQRAVNEQIANESDRIVRSVDAEARNWILRASALQDQILSIRATLTLRQKATMTLERLQQEAASDRSALTDALTRMKAQIANDGAQRADVDVVSQPEVPTQAAFPSLPLYAIGGVLAACLAGAAMNGRLLFSRARRLLAL
ncbi:hypothetical protein [Methylobacterium sp. 77]|uniref:GumC family protein n=1 Tax=Methylobacterium sp. 77 TaxID=1101192 RepID=UPI00037FDB19|nr:hypothetical protein [Methylobacterium sp. 77]